MVVSLVDRFRLLVRTIGTKYVAIKDQCEPFSGDHYHPAPVRRYSLDLAFRQDCPDRRKKLTILISGANSHSQTTFEPVPARGIAN